jgi:hypothetical protein
MTIVGHSATSQKWQSDRGRLLGAYSTWLQRHLVLTSRSTTMSDESNYNDDLDQPIALRRGKRRSDAISPKKPARTDSAPGATEASLTPSRARSKKRARFSDPGAADAESLANSSGLTPYVGRTTLNTPRRRASTPAFVWTGPSEIQFTPFRQVLDGRTKRRIRRNGLSQVSNTYESDQKEKAQLRAKLLAKDQELQRLKAELEATKHGAASQHVMEELSSRQRVVEAELQDIQKSFDEASIPDEVHDDMDINWDAVNVHRTGDASDRASDSGDTILLCEDDADMVEPGTPTFNGNDATERQMDMNADVELFALALDLETAKQEKRQLFKDVRAQIPSSQPLSSNFASATSAIHFEDSPASSRQDQQPEQLSLTTSTASLASPPKTFYADLSKVLKSTTHRAETAELALHSLEADLRELGFSASEDSSARSILENIRTHFRQARLELEHTIPGETVAGLCEPAEVLPDAICKLKLLSRRVQEREAELRSMHEQQRTLKGNFECGLRAAEKANQRIKELEDAVEEGADDLLNMRMKLQTTEKDGVEKDHTITSLIAALEKYRADVAKLEGLVLQLENEQSFKVQEGREESGEKMEELEAKVASEETGRRKAEESAVARLQKITALQAALDAANDDASSLQIQLSSLQAQKVDTEESALKQSQDKEARHEASLQDLNTRISQLGTALTASQTECNRLTTLVSKLRSRLSVTEEAGTGTVEDSWHEMVRAMTKFGEKRKGYFRGCKVRGANWEMEDEIEDEAANCGGSGSGAEGEPMTPVSLVRFVDVEAEAEAEGDVDADADVNGEGEVEGRVEIGRGRRAARTAGRRSRGLGIDLVMKRGGGKDRRRRGSDSGVGMGFLSEEDEQDEERELLSSDAVMPSSDSGFEIHEDGPYDASASPFPSSSSEFGAQE